MRRYKQRWTKQNKIEKCDTMLNVEGWKRDFEHWTMKKRECCNEEARKIETKETLTLNIIETWMLQWKSQEKWNWKNLNDEH